MIMSRDQNIIRNGNIQIGDLSFEEVEKLKYLGATGKSQRCVLILSTNTNITAIVINTTAINITVIIVITIICVTLVLLREYLQESMSERVSITDQVPSKFAFELNFISTVPDASRYKEKVKLASVQLLNYSAVLCAKQGPARFNDLPARSSNARSYLNSDRAFLA
ncbi:hypothetical protein ANN_16946 [Periplaneta americana]|uniref:Uncharacterized protein n=1 Tax=Periplaneta americana TaxID=6978 RepID=A0ABQ8SRJ4_PERAM|nr:hypothetical protein ANN_16946 [Periplaneta americana]